MGFRPVGNLHVCSGIAGQGRHWLQKSAGQPLKKGVL